MAHRGDRTCRHGDPREEVRLAGAVGPALGGVGEAGGGADAGRTGPCSNRVSSADPGSHHGFGNDCN